MDKKEYNSEYFQKNKERIYKNYKKRYNKGKLQPDQPNWYIKRKLKRLLIKDINQPKVVDMIIVRFD